MPWFDGTLDEFLIFAEVCDPLTEPLADNIQAWVKFGEERAQYQWDHENH